MILMRSFLLSLLLVAGVLLQGRSQQFSGAVMVLHGGAGNILPSEFNPAQEATYREALTLALRTGYERLKAGASSVEAVQAAIHVLEDNPLFNAGKGSVFTHDGKNEMDAAIMDGSTLKAGAVADVSRIRNPIDGAIAVMQRSRHVMLVGPGAEAFAGKAGVTLVDPSYFFTEKRWQELQRALARDSLDALKGDSSSAVLPPVEHPELMFGTVGAVALDQQGHLAAGTSTGGITDKMNGRVGDSPIIGAGTYADDATCGISCTGWGEYFMRTVAAKTAADLIRFKGWTVGQAGHALIDSIIPALGGDGGMILLDARGNGCLVFDTPGMFRGWVSRDGKISVLMYR